jgi:hypothetical protein
MSLKLNLVTSIKLYFLLYIGNLPNMVNGV